MTHQFNQLPFTANVPQPVNVSSFQAELNKLFGLEQLSNRPWLRIIWAQSDERDEFGPVARDWSDYGAGGLGEWRRRYLFSSEMNFSEAFDEARGIWTARQVWTDIAPPRFVLERLIPPDVACDGWDRWLRKLESNPNFAEGTDSEGDRFTARKPLGGLYVPLEIDDRLVVRGGVIADHNGTCCRAAALGRYICYGRYSVPGGVHLGLVQMAVAQLKKMVERRPGRMTAEEHDKAVANAAIRKEKYWDSFKDRVYQITQEALKTHKPMFSDDAGVRANGKYHFFGESNPNANRSKSNS